MYLLQKVCSDFKKAADSEADHTKHWDVCYVDITGKCEHPSVHKDYV